MPKFKERKQSDEIETDDIVQKPPINEFFTSYDNTHFENKQLPALIDD